MKRLLWLLALLGMGGAGGYGFANNPAVVHRLLGL